MDTVSRQMRSFIMRKVKGQDTILEVKLRKTLWKKGIRYRKNSSALFDKPDISMSGKKVAIFVDACFWHGCKYHLRMPKSNRDYWKNKISRNIRRDATVDLHYKSSGWIVLRFWERDPPAGH